jgi:hypothetical protein
MHSITPNEKEWLYVLFYINATKKCLLIFYIFKGKQLTQNIISICEFYYNVMQPKAWMMTILFNKWISHFITFVQACESNLFTTNHHLLILNGHNFHVTCAQSKRGGVGFYYIVITHKPHSITVGCCLFQILQ